MQLAEEPECLQWTAILVEMRRKSTLTIGGSRDQGLILNSDSGTEVN